MKSDLSLGDLKKQKKLEKFYKKKELSDRFRIFLILELPMRPELIYFIAFSLFEEKSH